jgi:carbonic anhydrase/acetyltransferase-like protein (isoleucine patch superfamily)
MVVGTPGKVIKTLSEQAQGDLKEWATKYVSVSAAFAAREKK